MSKVSVLLLLIAGSWTFDYFALNGRYGQLIQTNILRGSASASDWSTHRFGGGPS